MESFLLSTPALRAAVALGVAGALASLGVHVATFLGLTRSLGLEVVFFAWAFAAFAPAIASLMDRAEKELGPIASGGATPNPVEAVTRSFRVNGWMLRFLPVRERVVLGVLIAYTAVQVGLGVNEIVADLDADGFPLQMTSAFWLYFFVVSVLFGRRLLALRAAEA